MHNLQNNSRFANCTKHVDKKNSLTNVGFIEEIMDLPHILLAVAFFFSLIKLMFTEKATKFRKNIPWFFMSVVTNQETGFKKQMGQSSEMILTYCKLCHRVVSLHLDLADLAWALVLKAHLCHSYQIPKGKKIGRQ